MKKIYSLILLIGLAVFTAATVKASEPVTKPDTAKHTATIPIYSLVTHQYIYTSGQILACFTAACPSENFSAYYLSPDMSILYGKAPRPDSTFYFYPIFTVQAGNYIYVTNEGGVTDCITDAKCTECKLDKANSTCDCTQGGDDGECREVMKPTGGDNNFLLQLEEFDPIQQ